MNAITQQQQTALSLPERAAVALGDSVNAAKLRELVTKSASIVAVTNDAGREEAHRAGMVLLKTRTGIRATGKAARDDATKFSKAVIAAEDEYIAIIEPEELRVLALRDAWDQKVEAEKAAKIAAERARVEAISAAIQAIRDIPLAMIGKSAQDISACIYSLVGTIPDDETYQEFIEQAKAARLESLDKLTAAEVVQQGVELAAETQRQEVARAAADAEEKRIAAADAMEAQRIENARVAAENERIANEQAIERRRLADLAAAQEREAADRAAKVAANLKAAQDAQEAAARAQQVEIDRATAVRQAELDAQAAEIEAERQALIAERAADAKEAAHAEALIDNVQFDADQAAADAAERERAGAADVAADAQHDAAHAEMTGTQFLATLPAAMIDQAADAELFPTASEAVETIRRAFAADYGMSHAETDAYMAQLSYAAGMRELDGVVA